MLDYEATSTCRMAFLQRTLDDPTVAECGRCDVCAGEWFDREVPADVLDTARTTLGKAGVAGMGVVPAIRMGLGSRATIGAATVRARGAVGCSAELAGAGVTRRVEQSDERMPVGIESQCKIEDQPAGVYHLDSPVRALLHGVPYHTVRHRTSGSGSASGSATRQS